MALAVLRTGATGLVLGDVPAASIAVASLYRALRSKIAQTRMSLAGPQVSGATVLGLREGDDGRIGRRCPVVCRCPFLLIPLLFDLDATGQYFMAYRMLVLPASLVAAAVSQVFFGEASHRRERPEAMRDLAKRAASVLFIVSIPTYTIAAVAGPSLFVVLLGDQWQEAGESGPDHVALAARVERSQSAQHAVAGRASRTGEPDVYDR